ncbi:hypothetical protein [Ornithinimicrobium kibberense]|uniref:Uncharacterized protein n=1 Tax=Ornithinimicrobium kibberense TaxID=282060 RepID=A0ABV5V6M0_9MICO|nr:hypothetical protein [Ornithinimicrobium kibberense]
MGIRDEADAVRREREENLRAIRREGQRHALRYPVVAAAIQAELLDFVAALHGRCSTTNLRDYRRSLFKRDDWKPTKTKYPPGYSFQFWETRHTPKGPTFIDLDGNLWDGPALEGPKHMVGWRDELIAGGTVQMFGVSIRPGGDIPEHVDVATLDQTAVRNLVQFHYWDQDAGEVLGNFHGLLVQFAADCS